MKTLCIALSLCTALSACQHRSTRAEHKPSAPVKLTLETRPLERGEYELTLTATTTSTLDALELKVGDSLEKFSALERGATRTVTTRVQLRADEGREVIGAARTVKGPRQMTAATGVWLGVKPPEQRVNIIRLPDGEEAAEVRE